MPCGLAAERSAWEKLRVLCQDSSRGTGSFPGGNERLIPRRRTRFPRLPCPCPGHARPPSQVLAGCSLSPPFLGQAGLHPGYISRAVLAKWQLSRLSLLPPIARRSPAPAASPCPPSPMQTRSRPSQQGGCPYRIGSPRPPYFSGLVRPLSPVKTEGPALGCAVQAMQIPSRCNYQGSLLPACCWPESWDR